jgi:hypothetical protein
MSWQLMRQVFEVSKAKAAARLVLLNLAEHATLQGLTSWPSNATIARECGLSERGTRKLLRYLEGIGEIETIGSNRGGPGRSNRYRLKLHKGEPERTRANPIRRNRSANKEEPCAPEPEEPEVPPLKNSPPPKFSSGGRTKSSPDDFGW